MSEATRPSPKTDLFGFEFTIEDSARRKGIADATRDGVPFDGVTNRDVALMLNSCILAIMSMQTYRGRFLGDPKNVADLAVYAVGTAISEDALQRVDAIAEGYADPQFCQNKILMDLDAVKVKRDLDDEERRQRDRKSNASIFAAMVGPQGIDPGELEAESNLEKHSAEPQKTQ